MRIEEEIVNSDLPFLIHNKILFIAIDFLNDLNKVSPNFIELSKITTNSLFNSVMLYTLQTNESANQAYSRFFAPADGIDEDIVTGSANGPLLLILKRLNLIDTRPEIIVCTFEQGDILNRPGRVTVSYNQNKNELIIIGDAVTVVRGEFII
ncbi:MAG: PhzF family phenazine biosynthesis protein [Ignavibacteriales bacterium]|nr:PhzF family phenazine biosynthesis protein [Ignavibacteriales bacterium]